MRKPKIELRLSRLRAAFSRRDDTFWRVAIAFTAFLIAAALIMASAKADAHERTHGWRHHRHHHSVHHARHRHHALDHPRRMNGEPASSRVIADARRYLGLSNPTGTRGPWCRDFVNMVLRQTGHALRDVSRTAIAALRLGPRVSNPRPGDIVVMRSHVTFFAGFGGRGVLGLGGNQGHHRVTLSSYPLSRVVAFVRPR
jgi:uncharacterized protein (TIGR02594 family)